MDIYLPYKDFLQSLKTLSKEDLVSSLKTSSLILHTLEKMNPTCYQLTGGMKGTIVQNKNGRIAYAHMPITLFWEKAASNLLTYYNMGLLIACQNGLAIGKENPLALSKVGYFQQSDYFEDYCRDSQRKLLRKNYDFYSGKF